MNYRKCEQTAQNQTPYPHRDQDLGQITKWVLVNHHHCYYWDNQNQNQDYEVDGVVGEGQY
jgi:hypothetical protein